ncbi:MAG: hypothetical protein M3N13_01155, partial [Candidatus Eremiobacteraeota bacterium]|nr:hypothetical protein [Candidatus Eremiobacteraeota bacterium]
IMLLGGGTNRFVKWAAAQSITMWAGYILIFIAIEILNTVLFTAHLWMLIPLTTIVMMILGLVAIVAWLYTSINAFQGKEVRLPIVADLADKFFSAQLA